MAEIDKGRMPDQDQTDLALQNDFTKALENRTTSVEELAPYYSPADVIMGKPSIKLESLTDKLYCLASHVTLLYMKNREDANGQKPNAQILKKASTAAEILIKLSSIQIENGHISTLHHESVVIASSSPHADKAKSKNEVHEKAVAALRKPHLALRTVTPTKKKLIASDLPLNAADLPSDDAEEDALDAEGNPRSDPQDERGSKRKREDDQDLLYSGLFLIQPPVRIMGARAVIDTSAKRCKVHVQWKHEKLGPGGVRCTFFLKSTNIVERVGETKKMALKLVADTALTLLRQHCWTIIEKSRKEVHVSPISRSEVLCLENFVEEDLSEDDIKDMLLTFIRDFAVSEDDDKDRIVFTSELSKAERAIIHKACERLKLVGKSYGNGTSRYLTVTRKLDPARVFHRLQQRGGESQRFLLVPPGESCELVE